MSRDWQLDMERCKDFTSMESKSVYIKALEYWLQQYAAEKERGDDLQERFNHLADEHDDLLERSMKRKFELAEEKERANMAYLAYKGLAADNVSLGEYESLLDKHTAMTKAYRAEKERADKLREAIDKAIREYGLWHDEGSAANVMVEILHNAVSSLYPKEETIE